MIWRKSTNPQTKADFAKWVRADYLNTLTESEGGYGPNVLRQRHLIAQNGRLRQLVPEEWEAAQGFPMGWTASIPDADRFRAIGDSMNVHAAAWIGRRIADVSSNLRLVRP